MKNYFYNCPRCKERMLCSESENWLNYYCFDKKCKTNIFFRDNEASINVKVEDNDKIDQNVFAIENGELYFIFDSYSESVKVSFVLDFDNLQPVINWIKKMKVFQ